MSFADFLYQSTTPLRNQRGMSLMIVLVMLVVLGLSMGVAGSSWKSIVQRAKEEELLFRGDQYRRAIEAYSKVRHGGSSGMLPSKIEDLLKDPRFPDGKRHLRKLFQDPMTGEDFIVIKDPRFGGRIKGVRSDSTDKPFKTDGFTKEYEKFAGAESYQDWQFVYEAPVRKTNKKVPLGRPPQGQQGGAVQGGAQPPSPDQGEPTGQVN